MLYGYYYSRLEDALGGLVFRGRVASKAITTEKYNSKHILIPVKIE